MSAGFVYFVQAGAGGAVKIGFTATSVERRLAELQTGNQHNLILLGAIPSGDPRKLESSLHRELSSYRIGTSEWFAWCNAVRWALEREQRCVGRLGSGTSTTVLDWHEPLCSHCNEPIQEIAHGIAGWFEIAGDRVVDPFVVHGSAHCDFFLIDRNASASGRALEWCRRSPMAAIEILTRARLESDSDRAAWRQWIAVVLGLPVGASECGAVDPCRQVVFTSAPAEGAAGG